MHAVPAFEQEHREAPGGERRRIERFETTP